MLNSVASFRNVSSVTSNWLHEYGCRICLLIFSEPTGLSLTTLTRTVLELSSHRYAQEAHLHPSHEHRVVVGNLPTDLSDHHDVELLIFARTSFCIQQP